MVQMVRILGCDPSDGSSILPGASNYLLFNYK